MHSGLTLTAADGESNRCLSKSDLGGGAGSIVFWTIENWSAGQVYCENFKISTDLESGRCCLFKQRDSAYHLAITSHLRYDVNPEPMTERTLADATQNARGQKPRDGS